MFDPSRVNDLFSGRSQAELRERATTVSRAVRLEPREDGPWLRCAWDNGGGDAAVWFFHEDGRTLVLLVDHDSPMNLYSAGDGDAQLDLYRGLPEDMRALVIGTDDDDPLLAMPVGDTLVTFATGVFWSDGEQWFATDGLADRLRGDDSLSLRDTGTSVCLYPFDLYSYYAPGEFEPEIV